MNQFHAAAREPETLQALAHHLAKSASDLMTQSQLFQELADRRGHELDGVNRALAELQGAVTMQDNRLNEILGRFNQSRDDVTSATEAQHHELAREFRNLIDQQAFFLCSQVTQIGTHSDPARRASRYLQLAQHLCRLLFGPLPPLSAEISSLFESFGAPKKDTDAHWDTQIDRLLQRLSALRRRVAAVGTPFRWDFEVAIGEPYAADRYQLWTTASPDSPIELAVAPAYSVPGRPPYVPAMVFTAFLTDPR
ncbi:hypothetical protein AB0L99_28210 [Streptomyces sp. NPDC051954]|uniref:hypothetical protein n=1 Tax=Streptomyces sp. NPDC051954 TaxID=3155524 RepID=UPI0034205BA2